MRVALLSIFLTTPVAAQIPDLQEYLNGVQQEITAVGRIGIDGNGAAKFVLKDDTAIFPVQLSVGRDMTKKISSDCIVGSFIPDVSDFCQTTISAELSFDGPQANLLVFEVLDLISSADEKALENSNRLAAEARRSLAEAEAEAARAAIAEAARARAEAEAALAEAARFETGAGLD